VSVEAEFVVILYAALWNGPGVKMSTKQVVLPHSVFIVFRTLNSEE